MNNLKNLKTFENFKINENVFNDWVNKVSIENILVSKDHNRAIYKTPNNVIIMQDEIIPTNFLKKPYYYTTVDLIVELTDINKELIEKFDGEITEELYTDDGFGHAIFKNGKPLEQLEKAFYFSKEFIKNLSIKKQ